MTAVAVLRRAVATAAAVVLLCGGVCRADNPSSLFNVQSGPRHRRVASKVETICEREAPRIAAELGLQRVQPVQIDITDDVAPYGGSHGSLPEWGVAFALLESNRIVVDVRRATTEFNSLDEVVPHELSHIFLHQRAPGVRFPLWFAEGLAHWQSREWSLVDQWELMRGVWTRSSPRLEDMSLEDVECFLIKKAMTRYDGNVSQAAKALGLSRSALYRRLQRYGL